MITKIKEILNSVRFWQLTVGTVFLLLGHYAPSMDFLWNTLAAFLAAVATIGTVDKFGSNLKS